MDKDDVRPGGLSSLRDGAVPSPPEASIPDAQYAAMSRLLGPMMSEAASMTADEIVLAMKAFYSASQTNCPWYAYALRHEIPPILAIIGEGKEGYRQAWEAQAIEARQGGDAKQAPSQDESAVHAPKPSGILTENAG